MARQDTKTTIGSGSKGVAILGATGSIGRSTLAVLAMHRQQFHVVALTARRDDETLFQQCLEHRPDFAVLVEDVNAGRLEQRLKKAGVSTRVLTGSDALADMAALPQVDIVMAAVVGAAGLLPTLAAAQAGKQLLLANKESLVMAGHLFMNAVHENGAALIPIDSEHNAVFQCLPAEYQAQAGRGVLPSAGIQRILLTASGGPFRDWPLEKMASVTPVAACAHPNWDMGRKISVDSATMMNKGLEVIEACWLFGLQPKQIDVVVHPQSVVHSLVEYVDGSMLAQLGNPDMRTPIAQALAWPTRMASGVEPLDLLACSELNFQPPDKVRFPCLQHAYDALASGGNMPAVLNAANEVAVAQFLAGKLAFTGIAECVAKALDVFSDYSDQAFDKLDDLLSLDNEVREWAAKNKAKAGAD